MKSYRLFPAVVLAAAFAAVPGALAQTSRDAAKAAGPDEVQGMSRARMARIAPVMKEQVDKNIFPGAVTLIARNGKVVHFEAHGFQDAKKSKAMGKDAIFRMASMTKPIVTVAAMMLVEQGKMKLNDPIATYLPELKDLTVETPEGDKPLARPIWVQDLMRHTAGFVYQNSTKSPRIKEMYEKGNIEGREVDISGDEMLKNLGRIPVAHQPGTVWEYSIAVDVLGLLIERVAKKPLDAVLKDMLLDPLGMKDTAFWVPADKRSELDGKRYLSKKTVEFMLSDHTVGMAGSTIATTGPGYGMGLGFGVRLHEGMAWVPGSKGDAMWAGAWGTSFWIDPKERLVGILMAQGPSTRVHTRMLYKDLVYGSMVK
jgi:CubicO group peptidase (beta-lactamase class C family)